MLEPFEFLCRELRNIDDCLKEALRHDYGTDQSALFYVECSRRLRALKRLAKTANNDSGMIADVTVRASRLSALVSRIERSHQGEFSWSFAHDIRRLAKSVFKDSDDVPLFFFFSDGGLDAYRIFAEQKLEEPISKRIFNIVFPRTLKHHVLLHPILGHEIGHAALEAFPTEEGREELKVINNLLFSGSILEIGTDDKALRSHLIDHGLAPKAKVENMAEPRIQAIMKSWRTEFFCDLFGLLLMGPCYVGAHLTVHKAMDPTGRFTGNHPPPLSRHWMLRNAVKHLRWTNFGSRDAAVKAYWANLLGLPDEPWMHVVPAQNTIKALDRLAQFRPLRACFLPLPTLKDVNELSSQIVEYIPPVGVQKFLEKHTPLREIDFRTILFAGWIAQQRVKRDAQLMKLSDDPFLDINRLCEQAILQQIAICKQLQYLKDQAPHQSSTQVSV